MLFAGWEVRMVKNCDRGLENAARGRRPPTLPLYYEWKMMKTIFTQNYNNSPHGNFHRFLISFSSKFSDLNFASYVLYITYVMSRVTHSEPGLPMVVMLKNVFWTSTGKAL